MKRYLVAVLAALIFTGFAHHEARAQNIQGTLLPSASRTAATVNTADQTNPAWKCLTVTINTSAFVSGTYTPTIQGKDPVSGNYYTLLAGAAIAGTGLVVMQVCPGIVAAANVAASAMLPRTWRVTLAGAATPSMTFSVGVVLTQ